MTRGITIGVLTPVLDGYYFGGILNSVSRKAAEYDAKVIIIGTSAAYYKDLYGADYIDGWIVIMDAVDDRYIAELKRRNKPVVGINTLLDADYVSGVNNAAMMEVAINHLLEHGHGKIAYVGESHYYDANERQSSFVRVLRAHGIDVQESWCYNTLEASPADIAIEMADQGLPFSAIIAVNDVTAIALMDQFKALGISVPEQLAIIGVDDMPMARAYRPSISTFQLRVDEIALHAVEILLNAVMNKEIPSSVRLNAKPIFRHSCGCVEETDELWLDDATNTIQYLSNLMSRNYNLGVLMQSYRFLETMDMSWLKHSPFRKGYVGLHQGKQNTLKQYRFELRDDSEYAGAVEVINGSAKHFPPISSLYDAAFMEDENTMVVVPIVEEDDCLGVMALVGLKDISTHFYSYNAIFQLANFFASALKRELIHKEIETYSNQLEIISNLAYDGTWEVDAGTYSFVFRGGIHKAVGLGNDNSPKSFSDVLQLIHPEDRMMVRERFFYYLSTNNSFDIECRLIHVQGHSVWVHVSGFPQYDSNGKLVKMLGSIKNITERKAAEEQIRVLAYNDSLTGLVNRPYFEQQLKLMLEQTGHKQGKLAVLLFDLDRFKLINDSYGHQAGDRVLRLVANRVRGIVRNSYLVGRLGGDEFIIAIPAVKRETSVVAFAKRLVESLSKPFYDQDREYFLSCSIGISLYPAHGHDGETIIKNADIAMYTAKTLGRNRYSLYSSEINESHAERLLMENRLRKSMERKELILYYQPQLDLRTNRIYGVEALVRWRSPEYGLVSPFDFIPIAEETGIIIPMGEWVLREACKLPEKLAKQGIPPLTVSVNISMRQLMHGDFVRSVKRTLKDTGIDPTLLCLEITESGMLTEIDYCLSVLQQLIELGISISMDDFGTGYSSLSLLKTLPISTLKIDKSFVKDMTNSPANSEIVHTIIHLSHVLSIKVVAEGVETAEQLVLLENQNIDYIQGYYLSKPLPYEELLAYLLDICTEQQPSF